MSGASPLLTQILLGSTLAPSVLTTGASQYFSEAYRGRGATRSQQVEYLKNIQFLRNHFACSWRNVREGRPYTLFTGGILHGDIWHLLFNGFAFWSFGSTMCRTGSIGPVATMSIWATGIVTGNTLSLYMEKQKHARDLRGGRGVDHIGMSGGTLAMITTVATMFPKTKFQIFPIPIGIPAFLYVPMFAGFTLVADSSQMLQRIDHMGHLGGIGLGIVAGILLKRRVPLVNARYGRR